MIEIEPMTLNEYQRRASTTAKIVKQIPADVYTALGLNGEAGEVAEKIKKHYRDELDPAVTRVGVKKELGDTLWYLSETARHWGFSLEEIAQGNLDKLADRNKRGVVSGSGDDR